MLEQDDYKIHKWVMTTIHSNRTAVCVYLWDGIELSDKILKTTYACLYGYS